jgi:putative glycosyltransferase (TIGR04372 family)
MIKNLKMIQSFLRGRKNEKVLCQNDVLFKAQSYFQEANGLVASGHLKESIAYFEKAIAHIDSATYHHYKGNAHDRLGEFAEAENEWTASISKHDPHLLETISDIIMRLIFRGDRKKAEIWLTKAFEIWKKSFENSAARGDFKRYLGSDYSSVIGHVCLLDYYIKARILGMSSSKVEPVLVTGVGSNVNACLINYWRPYLQVVDDPTGSLASTEAFQRQRDCMGFTVLGSKAHHFWEAWAVVQKEWEAQGRGPLLRLDEEHANRGRVALRDSLGLKDGEWFVCLHVREPGFHRDQTGLYQTTRNADIETYRTAVEMIVQMGGKVIRLGESSMKPFSMEGVYDYALSPHKSDWMDVYLCASCRLFVGTASGLIHLPPLFGTPCALTNWCGLGIRSSYGSDRFIPKRIWSKSQNRFLTFREMMDAPVHHWQYQRYFDERQMKLVDNEPEEIRELVEEMLKNTGKDRLSEQQERFEALARAEPECYGISPIGKTFSLRHKELLITR